MQPVKNDFINRAKLGLYQKVHFRRYNIAWDKIFHIIPKKIRDNFGLVLDSEVDIVIDASGFSYSDQWGIYATKRTAFDIKLWKKQNTKVILMPQAFGPFTINGISKYFKIICEYADIIYAREKVSYKYINDLVGDKKNVKISPDFTNLLNGTFFRDFDIEENKVCIVPNLRMIDKTSKMESERYPKFMAKCLKILYDANSKPFFLIHEGKGDLALAKKIMKIANVEVNIVVESDALKIKGIIGTCDAMLGSRFHGLVNALSQGIPTIAIGWSHKYEMLLKDYNFEIGLLKVDTEESKINKCLSNIIDNNKRITARKRIESSSIVQKRTVDKMWEEIYEIIDKKYMDK